MLDGVEGPAVQKAMDLLVRYGEALGAERLVDTNNVCATVGATTPFIRDFAARPLAWLIVVARGIGFCPCSRALGRCD
jgi:short-subunit dehydrogenase involved in D-alanine esterification of teichoic acids